MPNLPVTRMILYKHGVGFFERFGRVGDSNQVELTFKKDEMNDILKSLSVFPQGNGQVISVSYETPEDKEAALAKAPIVLGDETTLLDLLKSLRGRSVRLLLVEITTTQQNGQTVETAGPQFEQIGILLGVDVEEEAGKSLLSLVTEGAEPNTKPEVKTYRLRQLQGIDVLDSQSGDDLRYVLELSRASADKRSVTILLNGSDEDVLVSYIAPTPTWRVSYRLEYTADKGTDAATGKCLLQGWGIVDNQLDEDLEGVHLTLIAGQPISFVYDLYTPRLPKRPEVADEERTVAGPVMFDEALTVAHDVEDGGDTDVLAAAPAMAPAGFAGRSMTARAAPAMAFRRSEAAPKRDMASATKIQATGVARGELFQYTVSTPVSMKRGQSAMVPIIGAKLDARKEHIYNGEKVPTNPVVTITATNTSGLTLERGPVTVLEDGSYVGEAVLSFTPAGGEFFIPYAVDLGVRVTENRDSRWETAGIRFGDGYLIHDWYIINSVEYQIENRNPEPANLIIEQRINADFTLFDTPAPAAKTADFYRWRLKLDPRARTTFTAKERQRISRNEQISNLDYQTLQGYLRDKFIDTALYQKLQGILDLYRQIQNNQAEIDKRTQRRTQLADEQQQAAQKLQPLGREGDEGALRSRYVAKMQEQETESERLAAEIASLEATNRQLQEQVQSLVKALG